MERKLSDEDFKICRIADSVRDAARHLDDSLRYVGSLTETRIIEGEAFAIIKRDGSGKESLEYVQDIFDLCEILRSKLSDD